jgi:hypothetical protein
MRFEIARAVLFLCRVRTLVTYSLGCIGRSQVSSDCASLTLWSPAERLQLWLLAPAVSAGLELCARVSGSDALVDILFAQPLLLAPIVRCCRIVWDDSTAVVSQGEPFLCVTPGTNLTFVQHTGWCGHRIMVPFYS